MLMLSGFVYNFTVVDLDLMAYKNFEYKIKVQIFLSEEKLSVYFFDYKETVEKYLLNYLEVKFGKKKKLMPRSQGDLESFVIDEIWLMHNKGLTTFSLGFGGEKECLYKRYNSALCLMTALLGFYLDHQSNCSLASDFEQIAHFADRYEDKVVSMIDLVNHLLKNTHDLKPSDDTKATTKDIGTLTSASPVSSFTPSMSKTSSSMVPKSSMNTGDGKSKLRARL